MQSKIVKKVVKKVINMADRIKDAEDRLLESVFRAELIADDGFSDRVIGRIRRRMWVDRLVLPIATLTGAALAFKPAMELAGVLLPLTNLIPSQLASRPLEFLPEIQIVILGGMLIAAAVACLRLLEE